jgi:hypothetical protein
MAIYNSAPAVGIIDSSNNLTLSWTPYPDGSGSFSQYAFWNIVDSTTSTTYKVLPVFLNAPTNTLLGTQTFTQTLSSGAHSISMQAFSGASPLLAATLPWQTNNVNTPRAFPDPLASSSVALSLNSVLLGQTLTVTLTLYAGADQWQVQWPDNSSTGWLPLSANVVAKSFSVPGAQNITVQTRRNYSGSQYNPPVSLIRQVAQQIFVVNQQQAGTTAVSGGLTGDLGFGGPQGFEIVDASSAAAIPNPWEIIARGFVRDTVTNELKLMVATTRFSNASSLLGTMAIDVFPVQGRPHAVELIAPVYELATTSATETVLVKIGTSTLPNLIVGKSVAQALGGSLAMTTKTGTGIDPFLWAASGLPSGVTISSSGVINGIPQALGAFNPTFAVQDSSIPFSIDEATLSLAVVTDLLVQVAAGQTDAQNAALPPLGTSLGVAQVGTPYKVQMQVGNTNPTAASPGGLAPYQWSIPAGALPIGLGIDPDSGIISGYPCTYNSQQDYGRTYTAIVQVTDAIGAKATQTYTMSLIAAALQFGPIDQSTVFALQEFKLDVPVWGGQSPYSGLVFTAPSADTPSYGTTALVDGRVEVHIGPAGSPPVGGGGFPTTATGGHAFNLQVTDSNARTIGPVPVNYQIANEISDIRIVKASPGHYWDYNDATAVALPISGNLAGYVLNSVSVLSPSLGNGIVVGIDATVPQVNAAGPPTTYTNSQLRIPLVLTQSGTAFGSVSREYTFAAHNDSASANDIGTFAAAPRPYIVNVDTVALNPRKPYFNSAATVPATISGYSARVQSGSSLPPGLSLDQNTGLIYGLLVGMAASSSVIEYIDAGGTIHGTVTIFWTTYQNAFQPTNGGNVVVGSMGVASTLTLFTAPTGITLANPTIIYPLSNNTALGVQGTSVQLDGTQTMVQLVGTPTEAGYFDLWIQVQNSSNLAQFSYIYQRVVIGYAKPMIILTSSPLPVFGQWSSTGAPASFAIVALRGFGGLAPYTWSSPQFPGPGFTYSGTGSLAGMVLTLDPLTGIISLTAAPTSVPGGPTPIFTTLSPLTITMTDSRLPVAGTVSKLFTWTFNDSLVNTTPGIPTIVTNSDYGFAMTATGGKPPYSWTKGTGSPTPALPSAILFPTTGIFSGVTAVSGYSSSFAITVTDSLSATSSGFNGAGVPYLIKTGAAVLAVDQTKVGVINRGVPYQGTLTILNGSSNFQTPVQWQIAPTPSIPNSILLGLTLQADSSTLGANAIISGTYLGIPHQAESIVQITGNGGSGTVTVTTQQALGFQVGDQVTISGTVHFNATATIASVATDKASFTYSATVAFPPESVGTATDSTNLYVVHVLAVDSLNQVAAALVTLNTSTDLAVTTNALPNAVVGGSYNLQLTASGGVSPYTWVIDDPVSATSTATLSAAGLSLSGGGLITGTASAIFNSNITFRVTDSLGGTANIARAVLNLTSQASGLTIVTSSITPAVSGLPYSFTLQAAGDVSTPYSWSIASGALPTGLNLSSAGVISGSSTAVGFLQSITFKVTDTLGANVSKALNVAVISGLALSSGIDYTDSLGTGVIGYVSSGQVTSINPRPNLSFYVVATGVQSTSPSQMAVTTGNANIAGTVTSIASGVAQISLTGTGFANGTPGNNTVSVSVTDSGTTVTKTFTWVIYSDGALRIGAALPTQLTTP